MDTWQKSCYCMRTWTMIGRTWNHTPYKCKMKMSYPNIVQQKNWVKEKLWIIKKSKPPPSSATCDIHVEYVWVLWDTYALWDFEAKDTLLVKPNSKSTFCLIIPIYVSHNSHTYHICVYTLTSVQTVESNLMFTLNSSFWFSTHRTSGLIAWRKVITL